MILKSLKVSNILSFKFLENFDEEPNTIEFKPDLNILIGSNGSGKSNLLEIINKLFQSHFFENYFINDGAFFRPDQPEPVIKVNHERKNQFYNTLYKNFDSRELPSHIQIEVIPDTGDIRNLLFILKKLGKLKEISLKYIRNTNFLNNFDDITKEDIKKLSLLQFKFSLKNEETAPRVQFNITNGIEDKTNRLFYNYLIYFNQLQTLIELSNRYEGITFDLLKNPFALISSMRQYGGFSESISLGTGLNNQIKDLDQNEGGISAKNYSPTDYIFRITSIRLGQLLRLLRDQSGSNDAFKKIADTDNLFTKINSLLKENLRFELKLENYNNANDTVLLNIYNAINERINFSELSMGQRSIFYLLFAVYGYDIQNGLLIIDEPELHLHVSMQKSYFRILQDIAKSANVQILIATHSSVFIDENTIRNTFRFFKTSNHTSIICPKSISQSQKDLIKILSFTNSSRIFFADKVLLVEGDSDEYFFNYLYTSHITKLIKSEKSLDILYIGGKGNFKKWRTFLDIFKITSYFIGDFDNIKEFEIDKKSGINLKDLINKSKEHIISKFLKDKINKKPTKDGTELLRQLDSIIKKQFEINDTDKKMLESLWVYLIEKQGLKKNQILQYLEETGHPELIQQIETEIEKLYVDGIFILKKGDLEDYLAISKDLSNVISFCQNSFESWIIEDKKLKIKSKVLELEKIFEQILFN